MHETAASQPKPARWQEKDDQIVAAAEQVFMAHGYARASMEAIACKAGVSKQTLYHHYGSKAALFGAIVDARVERLLLPLQVDDLERRAPKAALTTLGRQFLETVASPSSIALHRAVVTEVPRQPELGHTTYEHGPRRALAVLADYLRNQTAVGTLRVDDPELAAEQFYGMTLGHTQLRALFDVEQPLTDAWIERSVAAAVDVFLAAYGRNAGSGG